MQLSEYEKVIQVLLDQNERIIKALESFSGNSNSKSQATLGLRDISLDNISGLPTKIYCNRQHGGCWYKLNRDPSDKDKLIPEIINQNSITGYLKNVTTTSRESRGKEVDKIQIEISADKDYILEAGEGTHFAKSFFPAIAVLNLPDLKRLPVTIIPDPGDERTVLFCKVIFDGKMIKINQEEQQELSANTKEQRYEVFRSKVLRMFSASDPYQQAEREVQNVLGMKKTTKETPAVKSRETLIEDVAAIAREIGWDRNRIVFHMRQKYSKGTREELTNQQLLEFVNHLESLKKDAQKIA